MAFSDNFVDCEMDVGYELVGGSTLGSRTQRRAMAELTWVVWRSSRSANCSQTGSPQRT